MYLEFEKNRPDDVLLECMFERFKPLKFDKEGRDLDGGKQEMHVLDFLIAMNLLSRVIYDKKMKMIFELCDDDDDGCMRPAEILYMLQRLERIFCKECSNISLNSTILLQTISDKRAE